MPTLSLKISDELDRDLVALARRRGVSKTALIRDALTDFVSRGGSAAGSPADGGAGAPGDPAPNDPNVDEYGW